MREDLCLYGYRYGRDYTSHPKKGIWDINILSTFQCRGRSHYPRTFSKWIVNDSSSTNVPTRIIWWTYVYAKSKLSCAYESSSDANGKELSNTKHQLLSAIKTISISLRLLNDIIFIYISMRTVFHRRL